MKRFTKVCLVLGIVLLVAGAAAAGARLPRPRAPLAPGAGLRGERGRRCSLWRDCFGASPSASVTSAEAS